MSVESELIILSSEVAADTVTIDSEEEEEKPVSADISNEVVMSVKEEDVVYVPPSDGEDEIYESVVKPGVPPIDAEDFKGRRQAAKGKLLLRKAEAAEEVKFQSTDVRYRTVDNKARRKISWDVQKVAME